MKKIKDKKEVDKIELWCPICEETKSGHFYETEAMKHVCAMCFPEFLAKRWLKKGVDNG
jgi:hypothetical protein